MRAEKKKKKDVSSKPQTHPPTHPPLTPRSPDIYPVKYRNTSVSDNLKLFEDMRKGKFREGECTLRMKMDIDSPNPNMHDSMAYRIKYTAHPHAGAGWCIYPSYDFTHCIIDR